MCSQHPRFKRVRRLPELVGGICRFAGDNADDFCCLELRPMKSTARDIVNTVANGFACIATTVQRAVDYIVHKLRATYEMKQKTPMKFDEDAREERAIEVSFTTVDTHTKLWAIEEGKNMVGLDQGNKEEGRTSEDENGQLGKENFSALSMLMDVHSEVKSPLWALESNNDSPEKVFETEETALPRRQRSASAVCSCGWIVDVSNVVSTIQNAVAKLALKLGDTAKRACQQLTKSISKAKTTLSSTFSQVWSLYFKRNGVKHQRLVLSTPEETLNEIVSYLDSLIVQHSNDQWTIPDLGGLLST